MFEKTTLGIKRYKRTFAIIALSIIITLLWVKQYSPIGTYTPGMSGVTSELWQRNTSTNTYYTSPDAGQPSKTFDGQEVTSYAENNIGSPTSRLIVKNASLAMRVDSTTDVSERIQSLAEQVGGFVTSSRSNTYSADTPSEYTQNIITIRVPVDRFEDTLAEIKTLAKRIDNETITGQDVTEEYSDLQAEIKNLEAAEAQLLELFSRAGSIEEILKVQQETTRVRGQIEIKKGRAQYLEQNAQLSSITATLTERKDEPLITDTEWTPMTAIRNATRDLITTGQNLVDTILYLSIRYGALVIIIALTYYIYRRRKKETNS